MYKVINSCLEQVIAVLICHTLFSCWPGISSNLEEWPCAVQNLQTESVMPNPCRKLCLRTDSDQSIKTTSWCRGTFVAIQAVKSAFEYKLHSGNHRGGEWCFMGLSNIFFGLHGSRSAVFSAYVRLVVFFYTKLSWSLDLFARLRKYRSPLFFCLLMTSEHLFKIECQRLALLITLLLCKNLTYEISFQWHFSLIHFKVLVSLSLPFNIHQP